MTSVSQSHCLCAGSSLSGRQNKDQLSSVVDVIAHSDNDKAADCLFLDVCGDLCYFLEPGVNSSSSLLPFTESVVMVRV